MCLHTCPDNRLGSCVCKRALMLTRLLPAQLCCIMANIPHEISQVAPGHAHNLGMQYQGKDGFN